MQLKQAWHATHPDNIPSILSSGIKPNFGEVYVSDTPGGAASFIALTLLLPRMIQTADGQWTTIAGTDRVALIRINTEGIHFDEGTDHAAFFFPGRSYVTSETISADRILDVAIHNILPAA